MFATLNTLSYAPTFRHRLRRRFSPPEISCSRVTLPNFFSFYHLQVTLFDDEAPPWDRIADAAGSLRTRLLLPKGMHAEESEDVRAFQPQKLPLRLLCNSALSQLRGMQLDPTAQKVCIFDPQGILAECVPSFVPLAASIHIVTDDLYTYTALSEKLMESFGISLRLSTDVSDGVHDSNILICDDAGDVPLTYEGLVFTNKPHTRMNATLMTPKPPVLPREFASLCPPGIDPLQFASAAYELCAADELATLKSACVLA